VVQGAYGDMPIANALEEINKLRQISSGFCYADGAAWNTQKTDYLRSISWDTPTIIWFNFRKEREDICRILSELHVTHVVADGENPSAKSIDSFGSGEAQVIVAQLQSIREGVTLNRATRVIYYSPCFSQIIRSQSEDRNHRIGQKHSVLYIDLISSEIEAWMKEGLSKHVDVLQFLHKKLLDLHKKKE
jgi:SNF2 family DNA or RNA helicase